MSPLELVSALVVVGTPLWWLAVKITRIETRLEAIERNTNGTRPPLPGAS